MLRVELKHSVRVPVAHLNENERMRNERAGREFISAQAGETLEVSEELGTKLLLEGYAIPVPRWVE